MSGAVVRATLYRAVLVPPVGDQAPHPARFDIAVLIETRSLQEIGEVQATEPYRPLVVSLHAAASDVHVMAARNARLIADVDKSRPGIFLFNHFMAEDPQVALELWDRLELPDLRSREPAGEPHRGHAGARPARLMEVKSTAPETTTAAVLGTVLIDGTRPAASTPEGGTA